MRGVKTEFKASPDKTAIFAMLEKLSSTTSEIKVVQEELVLDPVKGEYVPQKIVTTAPHHLRFYLAHSNNDDKLPKLDFMIRNRLNGLWHKDIVDNCLVLAKLDGTPKISMLIAVYMPVSDGTLPKFLVDEGWTESFDWTVLDLEGYKSHFASYVDNLVYM